MKIQVIFDLFDLKMLDIENLGLSQ